MPPKRTKQLNLEAEDKLAAVIIADSFDQRLMPLTLTTPRCLLPLCNVPLIEYTFELLAVARVEVIYVFCCTHAQQIRDYIARSKWSGTQSPFEVHTIFSQEALSVGDVLRELDTKSLVRTDFILIQGDVVANMDLARALEAHRKRKAEDKNSIMTMVVKEASPDHQTRGHQDAIYAIEPVSQQCVHYVPSRHGIAAAESIPLSVELLAKHPELELRYDLMDCQIDICSVEVPALFTENFDYQGLRQDFVPGILGSEVLDSTFYVYPITSEYAARASDGQLYDAISRDVISRWTFPMVPDCNLLEDDQYTHQRNLVYKATNVILARTSHLKCNVVIGSQSVVGEHATIAHSVIGRNCRIGNNVTIEGAYLLDGTVVKDGSRVCRSLLGRNVTVHESTVVNKGCLLGDQVVVGPDVEIASSTRLTRFVADTDGSPFDDSAAASLVDVTEYLNGALIDATKVGTLGQAAVWALSTDDAEDEDEMYMMAVTGLANDMEQLAMGDDGSDISESESSEDSLALADDTSDVDNDDSVFNSEVSATLERAFVEGHGIADTLLELKGLRFASNKSNHDIRTILVPKILDQVDVAHAKTSLQAVLQRWGALIGHVINSEADQADALTIAREYCVDHEARAALLLPCVKCWYDLDVIDEEILVAWYQLSMRALAPNELAVHQKLQPLIDWLDEAEEEDEDSDEDDESDS